MRFNCHTTPQGKSLTFGCINIRSLGNKVDDLLDVRRDEKIDVMFLVETWHDSDSVSLSRLRADGFQVIERSRPRIRVDTLATNHGGIVAVAPSGVRLTRLDIGVKPVTFELLCARVTVDSASCVVATIYRPGSERVTQQFFVELSDTMDRVATFVEPALLVGDINIRLDRPDDPFTGQLVETLASYGFANRVQSTTHNLGGLLDIVATRDDMPLPTVDVLDVGLSDHRLLRWQAPLTRPCPVYQTVTNRPWRRLDNAAFRTALQSSILCRPDSWIDCSVDDMARLYDSELTAIVDKLIPVRTITSRRRQSDPWFDDDCRVAKRCVRLFERDARRANRRSRADPSNAPAAAVAAAATATWYSRRREYRALIHQKRESFWQMKVDIDRSAPRKLWRSVDTLLGRCRSSASPGINAEQAHHYFDEKVAGVRASTQDSPPPSYSTAPLNCRMQCFRRLTTDDVVAAVHLLPDKQCLSDPLPAHVLKDFF
ncbi:MAG TPA: endonuclease/exonuclease/phosphatase family protein [Methylomicrobium sp.]|nr:endonuclease/exonuclease/phosphatase family protein [Methylomicrobium sp.]